MKINVENDFVMFLIGNKAANGCSVIRDVLWRTILMLGGAFVGLVVTAFFLAGIVGIVLFLFADWYGTFDIDLSLSWLGNSMLADFTRAAAGPVAVILSGALIISTAVNIPTIYQAISRRMRSSKQLRAVTSEVKQSVTYKMVKSPFVAIGFIAQCLYNLAHRICPTIELVSSDPILIAMRDLSNPARIKTSYGMWDVIEVDQFPKGIRFRVQHVSEPKQTDTISWYIEGGFSERVELVPNK